MWDTLRIVFINNPVSLSMLLETFLAKYMQAYLGENAGLASDHHNKADITIKQVVNFFGFQCIQKLYSHNTVVY